MTLLTRREAADQLGISPLTIQWYMNRRFQPLPVIRKGRRVWIDSEALAGLRGAYSAHRRAIQIAALDLIADGVLHTEAAARVGLSRGHLQRVAARYGGARVLRRQAGTLNGFHVAQMLGVHQSMVGRYVRAGLRARVRGGQSLTTTRRNLITWLRDRRSFLRIDPTRITDPTLKAIAERAQIGAGGRWMGTKEIAGLLHYSQERVQIFIRRGWWREEQTRYWNHWYGWVPDGVDVRELMCGS